MGTVFWIKRFVVALLIAGAALFAVQLAKGHDVRDAALFAAVWGIASSGLFTLIGFLRYRRNPACMLPRSRRQ